MGRKEDTLLFRKEPPCQTCLSLLTRRIIFCDEPHSRDVLIRVSGTSSTVRKT